MHTPFLALDMGNTWIKAALYRGKSRLAESHLRCERAGLNESLHQWLSKQSLRAGESLPVGWINTGPGLDLAALPVWKALIVEPVFYPILSTDTAFPLRHLYRSPQTLGTDRLVAVVAACSISPETAVLVIDAGTAVTYDLGLKDRLYLGGAIAPGLRMRFRALHEFTARLPWVEPQQAPHQTGRDTESSILSGVVNGMTAEINGMIARYREEVEGELRCFLTGGDMKWFENRLENINFARPYLILEGIHITLQYRLK